jgi:hypothetical protein
MGRFSPAISAVFDTHVQHDKIKAPPPHLHHAEPNGIVGPRLSMNRRVDKKRPQCAAATRRVS